MRLRTRCKGGDFLVPDMDPFDLALPTKRVRQTIEAIADDAIDALDAGHCEHFRKLICDCSDHGTSRLSSSGSQPALDPRIAPDARPRIDYTMVSIDAPCIDLYHPVIDSLSGFW
jgi:hypothetical protein